ncbi:MAG: hypothetical protein ACJ75P_05965 [Gaiellaceae bacterium]
MSSLESPGFPPAPTPTVEGHDVPAGEPFVPPALAPLQPFDEVQPLQPLQPLETSAGESYPLQQADAVGLQPPVQAVEPLQPTMPPPPSPEEVANLGVPLGTLIFRWGLLTDEQLEDALQEGVRSGKRLGEVLLDGGLIDERELGRLLADQKGLRFVELSQLTLDPDATRLLSAEKAHIFGALPVGFEESVPVVAIADPSNELVTENLRRALGSEPRLVVASRSDLHATIDRVHGTPVEEPEPVAAEPVFEAQPEPVAAEPVAEVQPEPVATPEAPPLAPVAVEPVAPVAPELPVTPAPEPAPEPEPALRPVEVAHVAPLVPETSEAAVVPVPAPMAVEPAPEPTFSHVEAPEREPEAETASEQELPSAISYEVSLRLSDGERVPVGSFGDPQKAREYARKVVKHLADETEGWPFFSGRFLRPETIVSVDIVPLGEPDRWLGSSARSNWASRLNR